MHSQFEDKTYNLTKVEHLNFTKLYEYSIEYIHRNRLGITYIGQCTIPGLSYAPKDTDTAKMFREILDKVK